MACSGSSRKGWKKRRCSVCGRHAYYCAQLVFPHELADQFGIGRRPYPAGTTFCRKCGEASPGADKKARELEVAKSTKSCHRCSGNGRVYRHEAQRMTSQGGLPRVAGAKVVTRGAEVRCPRCKGKGRVAA